MLTSITVSLQKMKQKNKSKEGLTAFFFCTILEDKCFPISNTLRKSLQTASASPCRRYMSLIYNLKAVL